MSRIKKIIKRLLTHLGKPYKVLAWLYGAYLTIRFVDERTTFPAIYFSNKLISLKINKGNGARLLIKGKLLIEPWIGKYPSEISIGNSASLSISDDFIIGDDVHIRLSPYAKADFGGKKIESGSGITARSILLIKESLQLGSDVIIAWDTFITDFDWHKIGEINEARQTIIGDHVWIANGVKILKGSVIGKNSIVACGAIVAGGSFPEKSLIGGVPATVIHSDIANWER